MNFGYRTTVLATLLFLFGIIPPAQGQNLLGKPTSGVFGLKAGLISRMDYGIYPPFRSEIGSCFQVFADMPQGREFYLTTAFDFYYIEINRSNQIMIEASAGLKRVFPLSRAGMFLKPAISVGLAYLAEMGDIRAARFLSLKLFLETHFTIDAKKAWVGELGVFRAPTGSNGVSNVTFGPGLYFRWGLAFR